MPSAPESKTASGLKCLRYLCGVRRAKSVFGLLTEKQTISSGAVAPPSWSLGFDRTRSTLHAACQRKRNNEQFAKPVIIGGKPQNAGLRARADAGARVHAGKNVTPEQRGKALGVAGENSRAVLNA